MTFKDRLFKHCRKLKVPSAYVEKMKESIESAAKHYYAKELRHELVEQKYKIDTTAYNVARDLQALCYKKDLIHFNKIAVLWGVDKIKSKPISHRHKHNKQMLKLESQFVHEL